MPKPLTVSVEWETKELEQKLRDITENLDEKVAAIFRENEAWATVWMKANAPWTDNTGRARAELGAKSYSSGHTHEMVLFGGAPYQIWLEVANSGRFQILGPAMRYVAAKLLRDLQSLLDGKPPRPGSPTHDIPPQARKIAKKSYARHSGGSRRSRKAYGRRYAR